MELKNSLAEIAMVYSFFEKDQVLTPGQLNSITDYFDDQTRLTRVNLVGVGIMCGLRVALQGTAVQLTRGVGLTTDGDLLFIPANATFDQFKRYDDSQPKYAPFFRDGAMIPVFELVRQGEADPRAKNLSAFNGDTGLDLTKMVAVLLMESYRTDRDLCTGTDCDNLGQDCLHTPKLMLVDRGDIDRLPFTLASPHESFANLSEIVPDRVVVPAGLTSYTQLAATYRSVCGALFKKITDALSGLYAAAPFLTAAFPTNPFPSQWAPRLTSIHQSFNQNAFGIQYYYAFLKDLVEAYNQLVRLLFDLFYEDDSRCCPDVGAFPKHLLLGNLVPGLNLEANRTPFYPSPAFGKAPDELAHAVFLAKKIEALIQTFQVPAATGGTIRITPSQFEAEPLEERAIPYYYQVNTTFPIHLRWNFRLTRRGQETFNYSFNAPAYSARGGAANPLSSQIGRFPFFRIEGHLGQKVSVALPKIEAEIRDRNLPFTVRAVLLGTDRKQVVRKPGIRYSDLHRLHHLWRQDLFHQLNDVSRFSKNLRDQVQQQVKEDVAAEAPTLRELADQKNAQVAAAAGRAAQGIKKTYAAYKADQAWRPGLNETMKAAGEYRYTLGDVAKTEIPTAFDTFLGTTQVYWINWLDDILDLKDDQEAAKLLFSAFKALHPGMEHFGGAPRGGTFILVHEADETIVGDFMLPYYCPETEPEEPEEPELTRPDYRPDWFDFKGWTGIKVYPTRDKMLVKFRDDVKKEWEPKLDLQKEYFSAFKDSVNVMTQSYIEITRPPKTVAQPGVYTDKELEKLMNDIRDKQAVLDYLNRQATTNPQAAEKYKPDIEKMKIEMADAVTKTTQYVDASPLDVTTGSEGHNAMVEVTRSVEMVKDSTPAMNSVRTNLRRVSATTTTPGMKAMVDKIII